MSFTLVGIFGFHSCKSESTISGSMANVVVPSYSFLERGPVFERGYSILKVGSCFCSQALQQSRLGVKQLGFQLRCFVLAMFEIYVVPFHPGKRQSTTNLTTWLDERTLLHHPKWLFAVWLTDDSRTNTTLGSLGCQSRTMPLGLTVGVRSSIVQC